MGKYLKMADAFKGQEVKLPEQWSYEMVTHAAHAINSHDELVENMLHYKKEAERWEAIAVKEASMVQEFDLEVERLRDMVVRMQTYLDMAGEYPEKESDNPLRQWLFDAIDCTK